MEKELNLLLPLISDREEHTVCGFTIHRGRLGHHEVALMQCGIGKVNAAIGTTALIDGFKPELVINTGVAGGTGAAGILDVIVGERVAYHDVWCGPGTQEGDAAGCPRFFEGDRDVISLPCLAATDTVHHGLICSGDRFISRPEEVAAIKSVYPDAMAVDMESAAIAHVCHRRGVRFFCLRVLSDTPGATDDNISQYENFWEQAPQHTFSLLTAILRQL